MQHIHTYSVRTPSGTVSGTQTVNFDAEIVLSLTLPSAQTDVQYDLAVPASQIKSIIAGAGVAVVLETNSSSAADKTVAIPANGAYGWANGNGFDNPIADDIATIYITNVLAGTLDLHIGFDPTT